MEALLVHFNNNVHGIMSNYERTANLLHARKRLSELKAVEKSIPDMVVRRIDRQTMVAAPAATINHVLKSIERSQSN